MNIALKLLDLRLVLILCVLDDFDELFLDLFDHVLGLLWKHHETVHYNFLLFELFLKIFHLRAYVINYTIVVTVVTLAVVFIIRVTTIALVPLVPPLSVQTGLVSRSHDLCFWV